MHAKSILAVLTAVAACGVSVMANPFANDYSSELVERGLDNSEAFTELVEREFLDSLLDVEARSFEEELDARDISDALVNLEAREPQGRRGGSRRARRGGQWGRRRRSWGGRRGGGGGMAAPQQEGEAAPVEGRSLRRRNRSTTPLNQKQQTRITTLDTACTGLSDKKTGKRCSDLVKRLSGNMSRRNDLVAEITKMTTPQ